MSVQTAPPPEKARKNGRGANVCPDCRKTFTRAGELCWHCKRRARDVEASQSITDGYREALNLTIKHRETAEKRESMLKTTLGVMSGQLFRTRIVAVALFLAAVTGWALYLFRR